MSKTFDFYQDHSLRYLEMALGQENAEIPPDPDGYGKKTGDCRDTVEVYLLVEDDRLSTVAFSTDGCLNTHACGNAVCRLASGRTIEEAWEITPEAVIEYLETLPEDHRHCAEMAVGALYLALADLRKSGPGPKNF